MSLQEKYSALRAVNLIKENRCVKIKVRTCIDESRQHIYILLKEETLLTIALEVLLASLLIDALKGRAVQTFDFPGAYIHSSSPDDKVVHMKSKGGFVDIMCTVNLE